LLISYPAMIASMLLAAYVWDDHPGASDIGQHSLSGWLVGHLGVRWAWPVGVAIFSGLALFFAGIGILIPYLLESLSRYLSRPAGSA
jgi:hypothetical protein